jgi:hypothetical protein
LRYRTEIVVSPDRYVCLQLPEDFPEGPARVVVYYPGPDPAGPPEPVEDAEADDDIEWWEEFDGDPPRGR